jgi:hypothetical protein
MPNYNSMADVLQSFAKPKKAPLPYCTQTVFFKGVNLVVSYYYSRARKPVDRDDQGSPEIIEIDEIMLGGHSLMDLLEDQLPEIEEAIRKEINDHE